MLSGNPSVRNVQLADWAALTVAKPHHPTKLGTPNSFRNTPLANKLRGYLLWKRYFKELLKTGPFGS